MSIQFTIGGKSPVKDRNDSPGPCAYEPSYSQNKDKVKSFSMAGGSVR